MSSSTENRRARVGVSSCLLGQRVRYDGAQKRVGWIADVLSCQVELVPLCPEVAAGMAVPRPPIRRVEDEAGRVRLELVEGGTEVGDLLDAFCERTRIQLSESGLHGYLFKARSPSCGMGDTPIFSRAGEVLRLSAGVWAEDLLHYWPGLPVADETEVADLAGQNAFLSRVDMYFRRSRG